MIILYTCFDNFKIVICRYCQCRSFNAQKKNHVFMLWGQNTQFVVSWYCLLSGVVNVLLTTPLWVANTRLKLQGAKMHTKAYDKASDRKYEGIIGRSQCFKGHICDTCIFCVICRLSNVIHEDMAVKNCLLLREIVQN